MFTSLAQFIRGSPFSLALAPLLIAAGVFGATLFAYPAINQAFFDDGTFSDDSIMASQAAFSADAIEADSGFIVNAASGENALNTQSSFAEMVSLDPSLYGHEVEYAPHAAVLSVSSVNQTGSNVGVYTYNSAELAVECIATWTITSCLQGVIQLTAGVPPLGYVLGGITLLVFSALVLHTAQTGGSNGDHDGGDNFGPISRARELLKRMALSFLERPQLARNFDRPATLAT